MLWITIKECSADSFAVERDTFDPYMGSKPTRHPSVMRYLGSHKFVAAISVCLVNNALKDVISLLSYTDRMIVNLFCDKYTRDKKSLTLMEILPIYYNIKYSLAV